MKQLIIILILFMTLIACNKNSKFKIPVIPSELDSILDIYIKNNPKNDIYYLIFESRCGKQFFTLQCSSSSYSSDYMDGCFMREGKLIVYWSVNKSWKDSLLHIQEEQCFDSLAKYNNMAGTDGNYDFSYNPKTYRILSVNQYREAVQSDWEYPTPACDSNIIRSTALNTIVNDYINTNKSSAIVSLRFSNLNGDTFVSIGHDYEYDPKSFSGMFYRDERIVVIYSIESINGMDIIDKQSLLPIQAIKDYKTRKRKYPRYPENKYKIISKNVLEPISFYNNIWMNI